MIQLSLKTISTIVKTAITTKTLVFFCIVAFLEWYLCFSWSALTWHSSRARNPEIHLPHSVTNGMYTFIMQNTNQNPFLDKSQTLLRLGDHTGSSVEIILLHLSYFPNCPLNVINLPRPQNGPHELPNMLRWVLGKGSQSGILGMCPLQVCGGGVPFLALCIYHKCQQTSL